MSRWWLLGLIGVVALCLAAGAWLSASPSGDFWSQSVSFSCSYAAPSFESIVYSTMSYEEGSYTVVLHDLSTGRVLPLSGGGDRTAFAGASNGEDFLYFDMRRNDLFSISGRFSDGDLAETLLTESFHLSVHPLPFPNPTPDGVVAFLGRRSLYLADLRSRPVEADGWFRSLETSLQAETDATWPALEFGQVREVSLSPDHQQIAAIHHDQGLFSLRLHGREGTEMTQQVRRRAAPIMRPRWLPDGSGLTFIERSADAWRVMEWRASAERSTVLFEIDRFIETAELHPDRRRLLVTLGDGPEFSGYFLGLHVYLAHLDTGVLEQVGP